MKTKNIRWLWLSVVIIALDQLTKYWVLHTLAYGEPVPIMPLLNFTLAYNPGAAFSFLSGAGGWQLWFFTAIAVFVSVMLVIWMKRLPKTDHWLSIALSLIIGGALGNLWDRLVHGHVIDFIQVYWQTHYWPTFNVADSAICVGAALLIIDLFFRQKKD